jgi:cell division protein FtsW
MTAVSHKTQNKALVKRQTASTNPGDWDQTLFAASLTLVGFGIIMVASSSMHLNNGIPYLQRHLLALAIGIVAALAIYRTPSTWWYKSSLWLYVAGLILLGLVYIPGLGYSANGAQRWIQIAGFTIQGGELMKLFVVLYLAGYLMRRQDEIAFSLWGFVKPLAMLLAPCILLLLQPDFGAIALLLIITFLLLLLAGASLRWLLVLFITTVGTLAAMIVLSPYRMQRITSFTNPWNDPQGTDYQLSNALIAFGRGEWTGVGLGNGIQKQSYLPEAHTDFVMAVIGEEFGLLGTLVVIGLFSLIIWRAFLIGADARRRHEVYASLVAYGLGIWLGLQAFMNIGVNMGLLPTKGFPLPFLSYGNNSLIVSIIAIAMLLRLHQENSASTHNKRKKRR